MGSGSPDDRPLLLLIESDPAVRGVLEAAGRDRFRFHFAESLSDRILARRWGEAVERPRIALIEIRDTRAAALARLSRFRGSNPGMSIVLSVCYDGDYQLAADRLRDLSERVVFRPFEAEPVIVTLRGLAPPEANEVTGGRNGWPR
ncbi:MAG: hypothetical protein ABFS86_11035 [Planctomycetota bacterium]